MATHLPEDTSRRKFLIMSALALVEGVLPHKACSKDSRSSSTHYFLSPKTHRARGEYYLGIISLSQGRSYSIPIDLEGHSIIAHPSDRSIVTLFAQRPGTRSCIVDFLDRKVLQIFESSPGRHFYGHGGFTPDGKVMFSTENNFNDGKGVITLRDAANLQVISEIDSYGVGPHDMYFLDGGKTMVVAHGGLQTHPKHKDGTGATNYRSMAPSLAFIETSSGKLLEMVKLENKSLSIRHLSISQNNTIAMAIVDYSKGAGQQDGLVFVRHPDGRIVEMKDQDDIFQRMHYHTLSIQVYETLSLVAVTSPRGNLVTFWNIDTGKLAKSLRIENPSGVNITPDDKYFIVTSGFGSVYFVSTRSLSVEKVPLELPIDVGWGSHLTSLQL